MPKISLILLIGLAITLAFGIDYGQFQSGMKKVSLSEIITSDGDKHTGRILYVRDSFLLFWETKAAYESNYLDKYGTIYRYSNVERINIKSAKSAIGGLTAGALIGVSSGITYGEGVYQKEASSCFRFPLEYYLLKYACMFGGAGSVIGGIIGSIFDKEDFSVKGDYNSYRRIIPVLNQNAVFPYYLPVELHNFIQERKSTILPIPINK